MRTLANAVVMALLALTALVCTPAAQARSETLASTTYVEVKDLPREAQTTLNLIRAGGPYPYSRDGVAFGNREHLLPAAKRGYYHEYTVTTPDARNRGVRRIICGGKLTTLSDCYYTDDHYQSFRRIRQ